MQSTHATHFARGTAHAWRSILAAAFSPWLGALLVLVALLQLLAAQAPASYLIEIGREEGYQADLPLISGFLTFEPEDRASPINYRWTTERAQVELPGFGNRPLFVQLKILSLNDEMAQIGAKTFEIWSGDHLIGTFPVNQRGATYTFMLPANMSSTQGFEIRNAVVSPTGDSRQLGLPVDQVRVRAMAGPNVPSSAPWLGWLAAALLCWVCVRACGLAARPAFVLCAVLAVLVALASWLDPPRAALGWAPALLALGWGLGLVLVLRAVLPRLARAFAIPLDASTLVVLLLLALAAFALRYGGKIYPESMWGDIGFHANRFTEVANGRVLLLSRNRGVDFPYPPAFYLILAPFTLLQLDVRLLLQLGGALVDAWSPLLVYTIAVLAFGTSAARPQRETQWWALAAAGLYSFSAATFMTTWWNFSTHIFSQFIHLLLVTVLVVAVPRLLAAPQRANLRGVGATLVVVQSLLFLGHFGFWMNMSLLGGFGLLVLLLAAWRGRAAWRVFWLLAGAFVIAEVIAVLLFYSGYTSLFVGQLLATSEGGLTGMAGRAPIPASTLWYSLWNYGFVTHFGFFPVVLALVGLGMLWARQARPAPGEQPPFLPVITWLMTGTVIIAVLFALLPFLSGSSLSTRWLMFSAWSVAFATVYVVRATWRWGWLVRVAYLLMAGFVLWVTASQWVNALAYRIRPPEPF